MMLCTPIADHALALQTLSTPLFSVGFSVAATGRDKLTLCSL